MITVITDRVIQQRTENSYSGNGYHRPYCIEEGRKT